MAACFEEEIHLKAIGLEMEMYMDGFNEEERVRESHLLKTVSSADNRITVLSGKMGH